MNQSRTRGEKAESGTESQRSGRQCPSSLDDPDDRRQDDHDRAIQLEGALDALAPAAIDAAMISFDA
jgi:hypothetical protein